MCDQGHSWGHMYAYGDTLGILAENRTLRPIATTSTNQDGEYANHT